MSYATKTTATTKHGVTQFTCRLHIEEYQERREVMMDPARKQNYIFPYEEFGDLADEDMDIREFDPLLSVRDAEAAAGGQTNVFNLLNMCFVRTDVVQKMPGETRWERIENALKLKYMPRGVALKDTTVDGYRDQPISQVSGTGDINNQGKKPIPINAHLYLRFPNPATDFPRKHSGGTARNRILMIVEPVTRLTRAANPSSIRSVLGISHPKQFSEEYGKTRWDEIPSRNVAVSLGKQAQVIAKTAILLWEDSNKFGLGIDRITASNMDMLNPYLGLLTDKTKKRQTISLPPTGIFKNIPRPNGNNLYAEKIVYLAACGVPNPMSGEKTA
ncbi:MAG: hypothetical protein ACTSUE_16820 [Promethearchaeota archaeon]